MARLGSISSETIICKNILYALRWDHVRSFLSRLCSLYDLWIGGIIDQLHTSRMASSSDASSQSSLDTSYGTSHTSSEVSMEYELFLFVDDTRFDQDSHESYHEAEVYSHLCMNL